VSTDAEDFVDKMTDGDVQESGTAYSCGLTRSWVSELFDGLNFQYNEVLGLDNSSVGYNEYIG